MKSKWDIPSSAFAIRFLKILAGLLVLAFAVPAAHAADLSGAVFSDKNGNGVQDPGEEGLPATIEVLGMQDGGGGLDISKATSVDGSFSFGPSLVSEGCYAVRVKLPSGFRLSEVRSECNDADLGFPVGTRRYSSPQHVLDALRGNSLLHVALGDSIAEPASFCVGFVPPYNATDYVSWFGERLACIASGATTENNAIGGKHSHNLLEPAGTCGAPNLPHPPNNRCDNIFDTISKNPDLITISIGGNDWLEAEPSDLDEPFNPAEVQTSVEALLDLRMNIQEMLSTIASELPDTDVIFNTVYNPQAYNCGSPAFYNIWFPIWDQGLRDLVWAQGEHFMVAEIAPEYASQDVNGGNCCGDQDLICSPGVDGIHPSVDGAKVHLEKVWEAAGGVNLGPKDGIGASSNAGLLYPVEQLVALRYPSLYEDNTGGTVNPTTAFQKDDAGAAIPSGDGTFVVRGFDAQPAGIQPTHVAVVVRYRTDAPPASGGEGDAYFFEASADGTFSPPQYTVTGFNTIVPIVGAGSNAPTRNAIPDVPQYREVRSLVTKNLLDDGRASGHYTFPRVEWSDIATLAVRFRGMTRGAGPDTFHVVWDAAWLEIYGYPISTALSVYRSESPVNLIAAGNFLASAGTPPFDDSPPDVPKLYYAMDDGAGLPALIRLVKGTQGHVTILW